MRAAAALLLVLATVVTLAPLAGAQNESATPPPGVSFVVGGAPGIHASLDGTDLAAAARPGGAFAIDPDVPVNLSLSLAPPPNVTWEVRAIRVAVVVNGPGTSAPAALTRDQGFHAMLPPGFTVYANRSLALTELKHVGTGLFLMRVTVEDAAGAKLYEQEFYVKVEGNVLLTASGAVVTVASVATGYGLWRIVMDLREAYKARQRHKKKEHAESRFAKGTAMAATAMGLAGGLEGLVDVAGDVDPHADRLAKRGPFAWSATGLGLGGVTLSWLQFLGYVPFNVASTLIVACGLAATFLTVCLLVVAMTKRARKRLASRRLDIRAPVRVADAQPGNAESAELAERRGDD
jgi:hypothetical protein